MNVSLMMVNAAGDAKELRIKRLPAIVGRGDDCDVRVPVASVSRKHCELFDDDDELLVRDAGSSNGTYVNREKVVGQHELSPGDLLAIGPLVFVVRIDGHPQIIDAKAAFTGGAVTPENQPSTMGGVPTWDTKTATGGKPGSGAGNKPASGTGKPKKLVDKDPDDSDYFDIDLTDKPKRR